MQPETEQFLLPDGDFAILLTGTIARRDKNTHSFGCGKPLPGMVALTGGTELIERPQHCDVTMLRKRKSARLKQKRERPDFFHTRRFSLCGTFKVEVSHYQMNHTD